jgi:hypothetical protein
MASMRMGQRQTNGECSIEPWIYMTSEVLPDGVVNWKGGGGDGGSSYVMYAT